MENNNIDKKESLEFHVNDKDLKFMMTDHIFHISNAQRMEYNPPLHKIMSKNMVGCKPGDTLEHVFKVMVKYGYKRLPVVDENYTLLGIVTDRDIRVYSKSPFETKSEEEWFEFLRSKKVNDILPPKAALQVLHEDDTTLDACKMMIQNTITGLPVVNKEGRLTGIISRSDLLDQFIRIAEPMYTYQEQKGSELDPITL
ncbi:hypothetical protein PPL_08617 [Heterostelium album PN500]|uniref:CBS domain-containing protein n=1 Tax=Heterostelium pallidum (strain ATCC 26659 / Pp 5 / PN500) TaxID=670386 RepID=D3BJ92_HETP5|nr:hypothetical protein PPL_08617 [Heterostelium album PN500]EFA77972.1 hypothetical protein PPL_08617 [Heterostelium album PN500]|eukprot:XP_020430100.1 hypothetical protein PPL_08617 [Heterostelium album PN500]